MKPRIIAVAGHTASGKTGLAISLAERLGGEIVCCDSMQIYRLMNIGTAKPTPEELARVPHHVVDFVDPMREYSCAEYAVDAARAVEDIISRGKLPVICGGTGLYLDSLLFERPFDECGGKSEIRERLNSEAEAEGGAHALYLRLCEVDPESAARIDLSCGLFTEIVDRLRTLGGARYEKRSLPFNEEVLKYLLNTMALESGAELLYQTYVTGVRKEGERISAVRVSNVSGNSEISPFSPSFSIYTVKG